MLVLSFGSGDDHGLVDDGPGLALPEGGPQVRLDEVRTRDRVVEADVQVRLEGPRVVLDRVLGNLREKKVNSKLEFASVFLFA